MDRKKRLAILVAGTLSCGGSGSAAIDSPVAPSDVVGRIALSDTIVSLELNFSRQLTASVMSVTGAPITTAALTWTSDNPSVVQVIAGNLTPSSVGTAHVSASVAGKVATAFVTIIPTVVASVKLSRNKAILRPLSSLQVIGQPLDSRGRIIPGRAVAFSISDNAVATVSASGLVSAKKEGIATVTATSDPKNATLQIEVALPTAVSIAVSGAVPTGLQPLGAYALTMRDDDDSIVSTRASGNAALAGSMLISDTIQFVASADPTALSSWWPATISAARGELPASVPTVFIPRSFTFKSGLFAGATVAISIFAATDPCPAITDQCRVGFYPPTYERTVAAWPSLPVAVYQFGMTATDSTNLWDALHAMESAIGRQLFAVDDGRAPGRITVSRGLPPGSPTGVGGEAQWNTDASNRITSANVWFLNSLDASNGTRNLIQHEFIHALGFFHTCAWPSVMGGYGCTQLPFSSSDAAYILLAYGIFDVEKSFRLPDGTMPCGEIGLWATLPNQHVSCSGDRRIVPVDFSRILRGTIANPDGSSHRTNITP